MDAPRINATDDTPRVVFDGETQTLRIGGNSFPENTFSFYRPIIHWLEEHLAGMEEALTVEMDINYYNSSTSKVFMNLFNMLEAAAEKGKAITVHWHYDVEDEDAMEEGEEFKMGLEAVAFNIIAKAAS